MAIDWMILAVCGGLKVQGCSYALELVVWVGGGHSCPASLLVMFTSWPDAVACYPLTMTNSHEESAYLVLDTIRPCNKCLDCDACQDSLSAVDRVLEISCPASDGICADHPSHTDLFYTACDLMFFVML